MPVATRGGRPFLVLIANDQEWSARSLESILAPQGYAVVRAHTGLQALERARTARPDLIILDAQLPDIHGLEVCRQLRADPAFGTLTPIVITTAGPSGRTQRLAAYAAGAWELYGQPLDGEALLARFAAMMELKVEVDALRDAAMIAPTGVYSVRGLAHRVREIGAEAYRREQPFACLALALTPPTDASKPDAETGMKLGHLLREHGRSSDAIGHLGGAEYLLVAQGTERERIPQLVARLEAALREEGEQFEQLAVGYSAVANLRLAEVEPAELMDRATAALRYRLAHPASSNIIAYEELPSAGVTSH